MATSNNRSTELTAEWTVHAQLTISRPNANETTSPTNVKPNDDVTARNNTCNPVKVVYKWSTDDGKPSESGFSSGKTKVRKSFFNVVRH